MAKELSTIRVVATNNGRGPRGINLAAGGTAILERGATSAEVAVTQGELMSLKMGGEFAIEERGPGETVVRHAIPVRASRIKTLWDDVGKLKADVAELQGRAPVVSGETDVKDWSAEIEQLKAAVADLNDRLLAKADGEGSTGGPAAVPTAAEVLALFADKDVHFMTAKAEAAKLLGEGMPEKKAEIVAALEELATKP